MLKLFFGEHLWRSDGAKQPAAPHPARAMRTLRWRFFPLACSEGNSESHFSRGAKKTYAPKRLDLPPLDVYVKRKEIDSSAKAFRRMRVNPGNVSRLALSLS